MKNPNQNSTAIRLAVAIKRLKARFKEATAANSQGLPISQISILHNLRTTGPTTAAELAIIEHISQQAIAQNIIALKQAGLIKTAPDKQDKRKTLITITKAGQNLFESATASRNAWLDKAITSTISAEEMPVLQKTIELLERLADANPENPNTKN